MSILHHLVSEPRLMADANSGRGWGRRRGRGRGVDAEEDGPPNRRRDQRDLEIAAKKRRIRELERQLAEARMSSTNGEEEVESEPLDSSAEGGDDEGFNQWVIPNQRRNRRPGLKPVRSYQTLGMKIDLPEFEGISHPDEFIDWLHTVERVFEVKTLSDDQKVKLVAIKLRKHASIWWEHMRNRRVREGKPKIQSWSKMRQKLIAKFLPAQYRQEAFIEYHNLRQRGMSVEQCISEFDMLRRRCDVVEEKEQTSRGGSVANRRCFECQGLGHLIANCPNRQIVTLVEEDVDPVYDDYEDYDEGLEDHLTEGEEITCADSGESSVLESLAGTSLPRGQDICTRVPLVMRLQNDPNITAPHLQLEYDNKSLPVEEVGIVEAAIPATDEIAGHIVVQGQPEDLSTVDFPTCESIRMSQQVDKTGERTVAIVNFSACCNVPGLVSDLIKCGKMKEILNVEKQSSALLKYECKFVAGSTGDLYKGSFHDQEVMIKGGRISFGNLTSPPVYPLITGDVSRYCLPNSVGIFAISHSCSGVAVRACGLVSLEPTKIAEVLKDRPSWFRDCRNVKVFTMFSAGSGGTVELLLIPSGYLIRPYDGGGSIIHIVDHLNLESWSAPEILRPLYESLKDVDGTLVWSAGTANEFVSGIKILDAGNQGLQAETVVNIVPWILTVAAVVNTRQWLSISRYRASVRTQSPKVEVIDNLFKRVSDSEDEGIMREALLDFCVSSGKRKPEHIIIFRDGVSESQFNQVLNVELKQIIEACKFLDEKWSPKFVVIVAQKNHHTKSFQPNDANKDSVMVVVGQFSEMALMCFKQAGDFRWEKRAKAVGIMATGERSRYSNPQKACTCLLEAAGIFYPIGTFKSAAECFYDLEDYKQAEFAYNRSLNQTTGNSPFEVVYGPNPVTPLELTPLPVDKQFSGEAEERAEHIKRVHSHVRTQNEPHYRKSAFDAGEDRLGKNAHSLKKGCDYLDYIKYFDAHFTNFTGGVVENCVCLYEEDHGILWKHQDWRTGLAEVRRLRQLTVPFICTVANYEYGFYWHFYQGGKIKTEVKLTGILSLGALLPGEVRKYGTTIAPGLYAPVHQHVFVARMDMAVDCKAGESHNQVVEVNVRVEPPGGNNVHNHAFYADERLLRTELEAMRDCNPLTARHWIIRNTRSVNRTGQLTGYKLVPGSNCLPLAGLEAKFLRRAA